MFTRRLSAIELPRIVYADRHRLGWSEVLPPSRRHPSPPAVGRGLCSPPPSPRMFIRPPRYKPLTSVLRDVTLARCRARLRRGWSVTTELWIGRPGGGRGRKGHLPCPTRPGLADNAGRRWPPPPSVTVLIIAVRGRDRCARSLAHGEM